MPTKMTQQCNKKGFLTAALSPPAPSKVAIPVFLSRLLAAYLKADLILVTRPLTSTLAILASTQTNPPRMSCSRVVFPSPRRTDTCFASAICPPIFHSSLYPRRPPCSRCPTIGPSFALPLWRQLCPQKRFYRRDSSKVFASPFFKTSCLTASGA